jgi:hypothetical protein
MSDEDFNKEATRLAGELVKLVLPRDEQLWQIVFKFDAQLDGTGVQIGRVSLERKVAKP